MAGARTARDAGRNAMKRNPSVVLVDAIYFRVRGQRQHRVKCNHSLPEILVRTTSSLRSIFSRGKPCQRELIYQLIKGRYVPRRH